MAPYSPCIRSLISLLAWNLYAYKIIAVCFAVSFQWAAFIRTLCFQLLPTANIPRYEMNPIHLTFPPVKSIEVITHVLSVRILDEFKKKDQLSWAFSHHRNVAIPVSARDSYLYRCSSSNQLDRHKLSVDFA
jgi:hypothetical protein